MPHSSFFTAVARIHFFPKSCLCTCYLLWCDLFSTFSCGVCPAGLLVNSWGILDDLIFTSLDEVSLLHCLLFSPSSYLYLRYCLKTKRSKSVAKCCNLKIFSSNDFLSWLVLEQWIVYELERLLHWICGDLKICVYSLTSEMFDNRC